MFFKENIIGAYIKTNFNEWYELQGERGAGGGELTFRRNMDLKVTNYYSRHKFI